jgi:alpha-glucoside transport system permease protein
VVGALAAYAFAWLEFPGNNWLFLVVIGLLVVPLQMALIPMFTLYDHLGLYDTVLGIILFHVAFGLPFAIFLLRNYFAGIPITVAIFSNLRQFGANIDLIAPASFISLIVPLGVFFAFQRYFVQGVLAGSVK